MFNNFFSLKHVCFILSSWRQELKLRAYAKKVNKMLFSLILHLYCSFNCFLISFVVGFVFVFFASFVRALLKNMQSGIQQRVWHLSMTLTMPWDTQHTQDQRNGKDMFKLYWDFFTICLQWLLYSTWWLLIFLQAKKWIHRTGWR